VAPALRSFPPRPPLQRPKCPWLIVQGDADDVVDAKEVSQWAASFDPPPMLHIVAGGGHFFHGRLNDLQEAVGKEKPG